MTQVGRQSRRLAWAHGSHLQISLSIMPPIASELSLCVTSGWLALAE